MFLLEAFELLLPIVAALISLLAASLALATEVYDPEKKILTARNILSD